MPELRMLLLDPSEAGDYWKAYTSGRADLLAPDSEAYTKNYLSLDSKDQEEYFAYKVGSRIVGTVRLGYDDLVEAPHAISTFAITPSAATEARAAILLASESLIAKGADEIVASYDESYSQAFRDVGFVERFSRMLMEAPLQRREQPSIPMETPSSSDVDDMASFLTAVYEGHMEQQFGMHVGSPEDWLGYMRAIWDQCLPSASWLIRDEKGIAGLCLVGDQRGHPFVIEEGVREDRRREGLGRTLLLQTMNSLLEGGYRSLWLEVTVGNDPAVGLYQSLGFEQSRNRTVNAVAMASDLQK